MKERIRKEEREGRRKGERVNMCAGERDRERQRRGVIEKE